MFRIVFILITFLSVAVFAENQHADDQSGRPVDSSNNGWDWRKCNNTVFTGGMVGTKPAESASLEEGRIVIGFLPKQNTWTWKRVGEDENSFLAWNSTATGSELGYSGEEADKTFQLRKNTDGFAVWMDYTPPQQRASNPGRSKGLSGSDEGLNSNFIQGGLNKQFIRPNFGSSNCRS